MATNYGLTSLIYFLVTIILIGLEIGLGAYWVHIQPDYAPAFTKSTTTTTIATTYECVNETETTVPSSPDPPENNTNLFELKEKLNSTNFQTDFSVKVKEEEDDMENVPENLISAAFVDFRQERSEEMSNFQLEVFYTIFFHHTNRLL